MNQTYSTIPESVFTYADIEDQFKTLVSMSKLEEIPSTLVVSEKMTVPQEWLDSGLPYRKSGVLPEGAFMLEYPNKTDIHYKGKVITIHKNVLFPVMRCGFSEFKFGSIISPPVV